MIKMISYLYIFFAALNLSVTELRSAGGELDIEKKEITIENLNAIDVFQFILQSTKYSISFESESLNPKNQGVTARELKNTLTKKADSEKLSPAEEAQLKFAAETEREFPDSIVYWNIPKASGQIDFSEPGKLLFGFCKMFPNYKYEISNGHLLLFPKKSILDFEIESVTVENKSLSEVLAFLSPQLEKHKIALVSLGRSDVLSRKIKKLVLKNVSARSALTRIVQSAGPDVVWYLGGMEGSRALVVYVP